MDYGKLLIMSESGDDYDYDMDEIANIQLAFNELVAQGVELRDLPENAMTRDQVEELIDHVSPMEKHLYEYLKKQYPGDEEDACYSTYEMARYLNTIPLTIGAEERTLGALLGA